MPDRKPPRLASGERETLLALLQYQRESLCRKVDGVAVADARSSPVGSGTSLLWLVKHMARAEELWVGVRFNGDPPTLDDTVNAGDALVDAVQTYRTTSARIDGIIRASDLDAVAPPDADLPPVNLRWIVMHLLEETARHAGHADVIRELLDGDTGR
jgi:hypothetical protein